MPRPGPRPYECVRRAWHSDRHIPIKGSIIQQIFRFAHERHGTTTKKNREWQEKLPIVVLKAEEILYSKANSEAEYMDLDTLWDRVNDAIDTIIRRDETAETGEFLPPCVEAALTLGCVPIRASRSQRHSNPRSYLCPITPEPGCVAPKVLDNTSLPIVHSAHQSTSVRPETVNSMQLASESNRPRMPCMTCPATKTIENFPSPASNNEESNTALNVDTVYPLYYGTDFQGEVRRLGLQEPPQHSNAIILGRPVFSSVGEHIKVHCLPGLFHSNADKHIQSRSSQPESAEKYVKESNIDCDLSLRLGLYSGPGPSARKDPASGTEHVGPSDLQSSGKSRSTLTSKEFSFFPVESASDHSGHQRSTMISEGEDQLAEATFRKRKVSFFNDSDPASNIFAGQRKRPGL